MKKLALTLALLIGSVSCIHKASGPVSPWERVMTDNAMFAQLNNDAEQGTEAAQSSGLISVEQARPIIVWESQIADTHEKITAILKQGPGAADLASVKTLLAEIKTQGTALINSGGIGIKNPKTQQTIKADIQALIDLANAIISDVQLVKGGTQ